MGSPTVACIKYLLFVFNLIFAVTGLIILVVGAICQMVYYDYNTIIDEKFVTIPYILIFVGVFIFFVCFLGCCGACRESSCLINTFAFFLLVIFLAEIAGGITAYVKQDNLLDMLEERMVKTMKSYENNTEVRNTWDVLQHDFACCGVQGPTDWVLTKQNFDLDTVKLPATCCKDLFIDNCDSYDKAYPDGCLPTLGAWITKNYLILGGVGIGIVIVQLIGLVFALCLARSINKDYEIV